MDMLTQLEQEIADRISSFPFFANLTVLVDPQKNIVAEISTRIAKLKTLIAPLVASADDNNPNIHSPYFDTIRIDVGVFQNPLLKGSDPVPREICLEIHSVLKGWKPDSLSNVITPRKPSIEQVASDEKTLNIWNTAFETKGGLIGVLDQVAAPGITLGVSNVTMTCATAGAAIFYSVDGSAPNPRSNLYTAPFARPITGTVIKARAFLAGFLNSTVATATA